MVRLKTYTYLWACTWYSVVVTNLMSSFLQSAARNVNLNWVKLFVSTLNCIKVVYPMFLSDMGGPCDCRICVWYSST